MANMSMTEQIESSLNRLIKNFSASSGPVRDLHRLSGGASQEIWAFSLPGASGHIAPFILRRAPGGIAPDAASHTLSLSVEASLIRTVGQSGVKVPKVSYICQPEDGLGSAYIMEFVAGETIARKIQRDRTFATARANFTADCGAALAIIHKTKTEALQGTLPVSTGHDQIARYKAIYHALDIPRPVFELAFQTLTASTPAEMTPVLVHGDFRLGNLMLNEAGLCAVLDWELAHMGDPREDIGWLCVNSWRFGASHKRVGGIGDLPALLAAYQSAGGQALRPGDIDWWEMLGTLKWGIMCMIMYDTYRTGADTSVERVAIGRRVSETEIDLINLMEGL